MIAWLWSFVPESAQNLFWAWVAYFKTNAVGAALTAGCVGIYGVFRALSNNKQIAEELSARMDKCFADMEKRFAESLARTEEQLGRRLTHVQEQLGQRLTHTEEQLGQRIDQLGQRLTHTEEQLGQRIDQLGQRFTHTEEQLGQRLTHAQEQLGQRFTHTQELLGQRLTHTQELLGQRIAESNAAQTVRFNDLFKLHVTGTEIHDKLVARVSVIEALAARPAPSPRSSAAGLCHLSLVRSSDDSH